MSTLQEFVSSMSKVKGFARLSKYEVELHPPEGMTEANGWKKDIELQCDSIQMPGHDLKTQDVQYGSAPVKKMVTAHGYEGKCTATFRLDLNLNIKSYFDIWQQLAVNPATHKAQYYDNYIGSMSIFQVGGEVSESYQVTRITGEIDTRTDLLQGRTYGVLLEEVYPETVGEISYAASSENEIATITVGFQYKKWSTISNLLN